MNFITQFLASKALDSIARLPQLSVVHPITPTAERANQEDEREMIRLAFESGTKNLEFTAASAEILTRESSTWMNITGTAAIGTLAYAANLIEKQAAPQIIFAVVAVSLHLFGVAGYVLARCLRAKPIEVPYNEGKNLYLPGYNVGEVMAAELPGLSERAANNRERNRMVGANLNFSRKVVFLTPFVFLSAFLLTKLSLRYLG